MVSRLKSLELQGYKTFANRTVFDYTSPITAIIGPNGSGKSNIADSIRWVLGEQSYSLLRGKKTEDMIFSGSEQRSRASMASASLVFDNSDNWLPIDFSEVAITRRAYRDGQNEYLINGKRVRLKDVSELLAQSGLAERTYTIIGQGLVDTALSLKAEERRRLFEEAAGIGLYRTRREEALRRLEATQRNLERVQDILTELQPRLRSLERQSRRLKEYEQIKADLRALLLEWYGYHWHKAQIELTELSELVHVREQAFNNAHYEQLEVEKKISAARSNTLELRNRLNQFHRSLSEYYQQRESMTRDKAVVEERLFANENQTQSLQVEIARLQEECELHRRIIADIKSELDDLENELDDARTRADDAQKALHGRQNQRAEIERVIEQHRALYNQLASNKIELTALIASKKAQIERSNKIIQEKKSQIEATRLSFDRTQGQARQLEKQLVDQRKSKDAIEVKLADLHKRREMQEESLKSLTETRQNTNADIAGWKSQAEVMAQAEQALMGYSDGVKVIREVQESGQISGVYAYLGKSIQVDTRYEKAVAAALGEYLNVILFDTKDSMDAALDALIERATRGILYPLNVKVIWQDWDGNAAGKNGIIGRASELVESQADIRPVIDAILGNVFVVEGRQEAHSLVNSLPPGIRLVTLKGEVFYADGSVMSGVEEKIGLLNRTRRNQDLANSITKAENQLANLDTKIEKLRKALSEQIQVESQLQTEIEEISRVIESTSTELNHTKLELNRLNGETRWLEEQLQSANLDVDRSQGEIVEAETEIGHTQSEIQEIDTELNRQKGSLESIELDEQQDELVHWNAVLKVSERAYSDTQYRLSEHQANLERSEALLGENQARLVDLDTSSQCLATEKIALSSQEEKIAALVNEIQEKLAPTETQLNTAEKDAEALMAQENLVKKRVSLQENQFSQTRINLARQQERFESLSRRIEDDFGLVSFDYSEKVSGPTPLPMEGMVQRLPRIEKLSPNLEEAIKEYKGQLRRIGAVNPEALSEYEEVKARFEFMTEQVNDLEKAEADVRQGITELDTMMQQEFQKTFDAVTGEFVDIFGRLFSGGSARLVLTNPDDLTETGIDIEARLPGKRTQGLSLLSGGERSLTATALIFALLRVSPTPFCLLDEVDAMLDEANVGRFNELVNELSQKTQFIIVTHNRNTVQVADVIYGITMGRDSASQVISLKLQDVEKVI